ncbi:MAG TPA: peptidoglycan-associated lipoprotein Pal [Micavibrio sp.]|jgi:peptidoglycan-associated lipoprotein|nr:peptidoglycan-associated lipoprotein Pal [Pseudomonadota bacterium]MEC8663954.1 peptidoglycan-associated lipoprotein Pal [Pseudomonadota bacterium]HIF26089.1 peptidoglycan-associated lipoprotein Pal [Micavibrio sp.]HIL29588.1 peptidoglycan-associated lipoprotein Pal [Micavibrio sp.]
MFFRTFLMMAVVMSVAACSTSKDSSDVGEVTVDTREDITAGPLDGMEPYDRNVVDGVAPGTQQDLVVNVGDRVFFGYDRSDLTAEAQGTLEMQAEWLKRYPAVSITVEGHADERGTREYNLALGERRAQAMKSYLVALGIDPMRITTISYGKERPAVMGSNPAAWSQNRRGVTLVN